MALGLSVVVGVIVGVVLFTQLGPFPSAGDGETPGPGASPSAIPTESPAADPSSPPPSSPPPPTTEPNPTDSSDPDPAFTEAALLNPDHLLERGWETAGIINNWEDLPPDQINQCAQLSAEDGVVDAYAATMDGTAEGEQPISSAEVVMRFPDEATAETAMAELVRQVNACESAPPGESNLTSTRLDPTDPDPKVGEALVWSAEGGDGQVLAMIGLARAGDRIALLSLVSFGKDGVPPLDPLGSTDVFELTVYAGRRLV